jgi:hypothetical protein
MTTREIQGHRSERTALIAIGGLVIGAVALYLALSVMRGEADTARTLLPYQVLVRTLPEPEQHAYSTIRTSLAVIEDYRARSGQWPRIEDLASRGVAPFAESASLSRDWYSFVEGRTINYLGLPSADVATAWLLVIKEPDPNLPPDLAPLDDEHHRLPDGTMLHIYVWTHQFGARLEDRLVPLPQTEGWIEVFRTPPNPLFPRS